MHFGVQAPNLAQMFVWTFRTVQKGCQKSDLHGEGEGEGRGNFFKVPYVTKLLETGLYRLVKEVNEIFMVFFEDKGVVSAPKMPVGGRRGADILILK